MTPPTSTARTEDHAASPEFLFPPAVPTVDATSGATVVDLFAGAGGLSYGLALAGLVPAAALEVHPHAAMTYQRNHPGHPVLVKDARSTTANEMIAAAQSVSARAKKTARIDCLVGGPPCQGFSFAGSKNRDDTRNTLPLEFARLVRQIGPTMFVFENVHGLVKLYGGEAFQAVLEALRDIPGYRNSWEVLSAEAYGVPSMRKRVVIVGTTSGHPFEFPPATHGELRASSSLFSQSLLRHVSAGEALSDLDFLTRAGESADDYELPAQGPFQHWARRSSPHLYNHESTTHSKRVSDVFALIPQGRGPEVLPPELRSKRGAPTDSPRAHLSRDPQRSRGSHSLQP